MVPLLVTFNRAEFKKVFNLLNTSWMTEEELTREVDSDCVAECLAILKKGNLVEEQWRMPKPGEKPLKEFKTTSSKFRASFQCSMADLGDILHLSVSTEEHLRMVVDLIEQEVQNGNTSINDVARKLNVSPVFVKGIAKRLPTLDVRGQGLVILDGSDR